MHVRRRCVSSLHLLGLIETFALFKSGVVIDGRESAIFKSLICPRALLTFLLIVIFITATARRDSRPLMDVFLRVKTLYGLPHLFSIEFVRERCLHPRSSWVKSR